MAFAVDRDGGYEGHLVLGAAPDLATRAFTTEIGIVELHGTPQAMRALLAHGVSLAEAGFQSGVEKQIRLLRC